MARHFNGTTDYIDCGTSVRGSDVQTMLIAAWVMLDDNLSEHVIASRFDGTTAESWLLTTGSSTTGRLGFFFCASDFTVVGKEGATTLTPGTLFHVGASWDGTTIRVYVGGVLDGSSVPGKTMKTGTLAMLIGRHAVGAFMKGTVGEVTLMLAAENEAEMMKELAAGASPKDVEGLSNHDHIGYWPLLGDSPEMDASGNRHNGTVHGTTVVDGPPARSITAYEFC